MAGIGFGLMLYWEKRGKAFDYEYRRRGTENNDELYGGLGNDDLWGGYGDNLLYGGGGDDRLRGYDGNDELYGGRGEDYLTGFTGNDILDGGRGNDSLSGGDGDDELWGQRGNDGLSGGRGDDWIYGNRGDDVLSGNAGDDQLIGGKGADKFWYSLKGINGKVPQGNDTIRDFTLGEDKIALKAGPQAFDDLIIEQGAGGAVISISGYGDAGDTITLLGIDAASLTAADFDLI